MHMNNNILTYFSLFAGAGGLDIGFKSEGFISLGASDIMQDSKNTFELKTVTRKATLKI